ncbi:MAG: enoyl-CoA hydratase/isomerase family protein [Actinomycetota bacterium]
MSSNVEVTAHDAVRVVTINRPQKRNALSIELRRELATMLSRLSGDPACSVVILAGEGEHFCSGMDTSQFGGDDHNRRALLESSMGLFHALRSCERPVIASIRGACIAGGFALATWCDIRISAPDAVFWIPEVSMGFAQSWGTLRHALGDQLARRVAFTGEKFGATQALEWGFVMEISEDPFARSLELAHLMARNPLNGLRDSKRLMISSAESSIQRALDEEMRIFSASLHHPRSEADGKH